MRLLSEDCKVDAAIAYGAAAVAPGVFSRYFGMDRWCKALFIVIADTLALAATVVLTISEATNHLGAAAQPIATGTCTITANTNASIITITVGVVLVADTVTINGVVFTAAAVPNHALQIFDQSSGVAATIATDLAACINNAVSQGLLTAASNGAGVTVADNLAAVLTLTITDAGESVLTVTSSNAVRLTIATVQALAYIEVEDTALTATFNHIAINAVGTAGTENVAVALVRGHPRYGAAAQFVAASDTDD